MTHSICLAGLLTGTVLAAAPDPAPVCSLGQLVRMSRCDLEGLYRGAAPGPVPYGAHKGRAIFSPGTRRTVPAACLTGLLWQGKEIRPDDVMLNRMLGLRVVPARVSYGESWLDGGPAIVLDYSDTSRLFPDVRDEMREVAPGLYLGLTYRRGCPEPKLLTFFALDARHPGRCPLR
jgi:hypothetical protein